MVKILALMSDMIQKKQYLCTKNLSVAAALLGSLAISVPAHALDFYFEFSNTGSNVNGTVTGIIRWLQDNANGQQATEIQLLTYPAGLGTSKQEQF